MKSVHPSPASPLPPPLFSRFRYHRYGLEDEDFLAAFEGVRTVERGYDGLARAFGGGNRAGR